LWTAKEQTPHIARLKTDVFREQVQIDEKLKGRLAAIREKGKEKAKGDAAKQELANFRTELGPLDAVETGIIVDLMLSHRALEDWDGMIAVFGDMPETLEATDPGTGTTRLCVQRRAGKTKNAADRAEALRIWLLEEHFAEKPANIDSRIDIVYSFHRAFLAAAQPRP